MDPFQELRKKALAKRNAAIKKATQEYEEAIVRIHALENDLRGRENPKDRKVSDCIMQVLPHDKPFTVQDIYLALMGLDASRDWARRSVECFIIRLRERGIVKRLRSHHGRDLAVYATMDSGIEVYPFGDKTLLEAMQEIMAGKGPMSPIEITVTLLEAGFYTTRNRREFRASVGSALNTNPDLFENGEGGKWVINGSGVICRLDSQRLARELF